MEVVDNFLSDYYFKQLQSIIMDWPWYYNDSIIAVPKNRHRFQFTNAILDDQGICKERYDVLEPLISKLNVKKLFRIKANLQTRTLINRSGGYHVDKCPCPYTGVYYINTNNGYTKFKKGGKVKSVANRMVIFNSSLEHTGFSCTDEKIRIVINFNWE